MLLLLLGCHALVPTAPPPVAPDLGERLGAGQVRAGVAEDAAVLFDGVSAEGRVGDVKIYNDRVQFVIQQVGDSSFYGDYGGQLIDADLVRPEGQLGRDIIDDFWTMAGLARVMDATQVEVLSDGSDGAAHVRCSGPAAPLRLVTGALESPEIVPDSDLTLTTDYVLAPDTWSLSITTTIQNDSGADQALVVGDGIMRSLEVASGWAPGSGFDTDALGDTSLVGVIQDHDEQTMALAVDEGSFELGASAALLSALGDITSGFLPPVTVAAGQSFTWTRAFGVAPDMATLTAEQLSRQGKSGTTVSGHVTAGGAPVEGARVHVLDANEAPLTVAFTDADGAWTATVDTTATRYVASGRGPGYHYDLPDGYGPMSPYAPDPQAVLDALADGAVPIPFADGYGVSAVSDSPELTLTPPGTLSVTIPSGAPALARLCFPAGDPVTRDARLVPGRPADCAALLYVVDGELSVPVEPGDYHLLVHRGVRHELDEQDLTITSGQTTSVEADPALAWDLPGIIAGDPHNHASPSGDGSIPMAERLLTVATNGIDVHFGTDHDHVADYRPLLGPVGLADRLHSVVADEVSPVLRGHFNAWPATATPGTANNGAPRWWQGYSDTSEIFGWMRTLVGDGVIQANHPVGNSGMFSFADYDWNEGKIGKPDAWSDDFDAMEVLNSGDWSEYLPAYLDLTRRGHTVTPVGVSDSHGPTSGHIGLNFTFFLVGDADVSSDAALDAALVDAVHRGATAAVYGPYVDTRVDGVFAAGQVVPAGTALDVVVYAPSWIPVETVTLWKDGEAVDSAPCEDAAPMPCQARFVLDPERDASYVVIASSSSQAMGGPHAGQLAWGLAAATFVDVDGDGWEPAFSALY